MEHSEYDGEDPLSEPDADYHVLPRPQELIHSQLESSAFQSLRSRSKERALKERLQKQLSRGLSKKLLKKKERQKSNPTSPLQGLESKRKDKRNKYPLSPPESLGYSSPENQDRYSLRSTSPGSDEYYSSQDLQRKKMKEQSFAAQERYDILNKRDSDLREREARVEPKRKVIKGTCPDMCSEKERYSRIAKNCLSVYEMKMGLDPASNSKDVDHRFMVKEYSRSSADQQEPLPNELRPVPVLKFTMDYLICNIIDRQDEAIPIAEWYDFIWNRTRSIRKDITQQQLGDVQCVYILEKCARFHILCAEFLSEEDTATFDPKINNENLTKCLQTLKHMYYDLQTKGIQCPNEAEFRAYDILLSLSEGETLRLVKDIRKEVFKTPHVKLAFEAALAFKSNNFVRFFNLMKKAPYLSSCIMHRYMHEARIRAMNVIVRSYTVQNKSTSYPLLYLVRDLKFRDSAEAAQFCSWHGLTVDEVDVTLQKQLFHRPSSNYQVERSSFLVGTKLESGFGVIVNNGPLPENPLNWYQPHNSFDENGKFVEENYCNEEESYCNEEESMSQEEISSHVVSDFEDSPSFPVIQLEKEDIFPFETVPSPSDVNELDEIPVTQHQSEIKTLESPLPIPSDIKEDKLSTASSSFSFKTTPNKDFAHINPPAPLRSTLMTKFLSKEDPEHLEVLSESPFIANLAPKSPLVIKSPEIMFSRLPSISSAVKSPAVKTPFQSFQWPVVTLEGAEDEPVGDEPGEEYQKDDLETQSVICEEDNSLGESDGKESDHENEPMNEPLQETKPAFPGSPEIYLSDTEFVPEEVPETLNLYDNEDEETLRKIREEKITQLLSTIATEVLMDSTKNLYLEIATEIMAEEWKIKTKYDEFVAKRKEILSRKVFNKWKLFCERKKQRHTFLEPLSPWTPMLMNAEYVTAGASSPFSAYKKHCSLSKLADRKIEEKVMKPGWESLVAEDFSSLLNQKVYPPAYTRGTLIYKFLKVAVIFSKFKDENTDVFMRWICKKFKFSMDAKVSRTKNSSCFQLNKGKTVICFSGFSLNPDTDVNIGNFMKGTSAVILCCPESFPDFKVFQSVWEKLSQVFESADLLTRLPVFCCILPSKYRCNVVNQLDIFMEEKLYSSRIFNSVKMGYLNEPSKGKDNTEVMLSAVQWLFENQAIMPKLVYRELHDYVKDSYISAFNWIFWKASLPEFNILYKKPEYSINFYNKVLEFRSEILCSPSLKKVSQCWPPEELLIQEPDFKFIDISFHEELKRFFKSLCLPEFIGDPYNMLDLWQYVRGVSHAINADSEMLFIGVKSVLKDSENKIHWPRIISKCANYLICYQCSKILMYIHDYVYYLEDELGDNNFKEYWQTLVPMLPQCNSTDEIQSNDLNTVGRPHTFAKVARRLVIGALGLKVQLTSEEKEQERIYFEQAKGKKRKFSECEHLQRKHINLTSEESHEADKPETANIPNMPHISEESHEADKPETVNITNMPDISEESHEADIPETVNITNMPDISEESHEADKPETVNMTNMPDISDKTSNYGSGVLQSIQAALKKHAEEEEKLNLKLHQSIRCGSLFEDIESPECTDMSNTTVPPCIGAATDNVISCVSGTEPVEQMEEDSAETIPESNVWKKFLENLNSGMFSTSIISEKLEDLRYNIEKNSILDDNINQYLGCDSSFG